MQQAILSSKEIRKAGALIRAAIVTTVLIAALSALCASVGAENRVEHFLTDSIVEPGAPKIMGWSLSNGNGRSVDISIDIASHEPFTVYKVEWLNCGTIRKTLDPFTLVAQPDSVTDKATLWRLFLEYPYTQYFDEDDLLNVYTDKGTLTLHTSHIGKYKAEMAELKKTHDAYVARSEKHDRNVIFLIIGVVVLLSGGGIWLYASMRRNLARRDMEIGELSTMVRERSDLNLELRNKVNALYKSRLETLNMLCDAYFNNNESDKTKQLFYRDVEKSILSLRDDKSVEELEVIVNEYLDDTIARVRSQLPELSMSDLKFLTYIYAGFSPRAVCVFMNIKMKTFYNRRNLLKERILASDAPDKERFVSLIS